MSIMGLDLDLMHSYIESTTVPPTQSKASETYPVPERRRKQRKKYLESTVAVRRRMAPACTRSARELGPNSALGHSSWWEPRFPEPFLPPMPGMPRRPMIDGNWRPGMNHVTSPWEHPPSRVVDGVRSSAALLESPARCPTPHFVRHFRAPRARGVRWVLEGVIKNRSRSALSDANMSGNYPRSEEGHGPRRHLPALPESQLYQYNMQLRKRGFTSI